jgi:hypothetical protein
LYTDEWQANIKESKMTIMRKEHTKETLLKYCPVGARLFYQLKHAKGDYIWFSLYAITKGETLRTNKEVDVIVRLDNYVNALLGVGEIELSGGDISLYSLYGKGGYLYPEDVVKSLSNELYGDPMALYAQHLL